MRPIEWHKRKKTSQSAFVRGFIDDWCIVCLLGRTPACLNPRSCAASSMTWSSVFFEGKCNSCLNPRSCAASSMTPELASAFAAAIAGLNPRSCAASSMTGARVRGPTADRDRLNPRSCAASSMTGRMMPRFNADWASQSAFVRGFIDDGPRHRGPGGGPHVSIRVRARLHR